MRSWWHAGLMGMLLGLAAAPAWCAPDTSGEPPAPPAADAAAEAETPVEPARISMDFKDADLKDVLKAFSEQSGLNVIAGQDIGTQRITVYLQDVSVIDALDQILRAGNLLYERVPGSEIYIVKAKPASTAPVIATITRVYRVKYARVSTSILAKAAKEFGSRTPFESSLADQSAQSQAQAGNTADDVGIDTIVREVLTSQGEVVVDPRTNSVIVTDVPENFPRIEGVLAALDIRTPQILVDAEIIETTLTKLKDLGVEWGSGSEGTLLTFTPAQRATGFPFSLTNSNQSAQEMVATTVSGAPAFTRNGQISLGTLNMGQLNAVLQALERDTETKILARPKVITLDNESAVIRLTSSQAVGISSTTISETGTVSQTAERVTTGVILVVTPQVNENGYITMLVEPAVTKTVPSVIASNIVDPKTRSARAMVRIRQGDTLVLGGMIDRSEQESLQKVPILSGIPFIGEMFKNDEITNSESELVVFVTPRILGESGPSQVAAASAAPYMMREQTTDDSRQEQIEKTLNQLEQPPL